ncbi:MAG TPA: hypothetical protein VFW96_22575 [Thermomicrobiales bacterium]|nr:hypothetical protein [Thermomicrobiales bacterium]
MSEYQYYEFQAVDRPLTKDELAELRALSSRATITPTRFVNVYNFGDFRGDPLALMEHYFDLHVYVANWGTHQFMLRLPRALLDPDAVAPYRVEYGVEVHAGGDDVILEFISQDEEGGSWEESGEEWLPDLLPLRDALADGDLRALYLGWLACVVSGVLEDEAAREPPVPPGLGALTAPLAALARFLRVDDDLLAVAAERSAPARATRPLADDLARWVRDLPAAEKDALLLRVLEGDERHLHAELRRRAREALAARTPDPATVAGGRTVGELLAVAEERTRERQRQEAERAARERARRDREEAAARAAYLEHLAPRQDATWRAAEALIETKQPAKYDQAVQLLVDLRDVSARQQTTAAYRQRLADLRARHATKRSLHSRLDHAGLSGG